MSFKYLRDPLFLFCFAAYWAHRWLADCGLSTPWLRGYLNDVICVPFWMPIMLWLSKRLGMRRHDGPPDNVEIVVPLLVWAVLFEVVIPSQEAWHVPTVADPCDVLSYCIGALAAAVFWRWYYGSGKSGTVGAPQGNATACLAAADGRSTKPGSGQDLPGERKEPAASQKFIVETIKTG